MRSMFLLKILAISFEDTSDAVDTLVESSMPIADEIYIHEDNQDSQETEIESIVIVLVCHLLVSC